MIYGRDLFIHDQCFAYDRNGWYTEPFTHWFVAQYDFYCTHHYSDDTDREIFAAQQRNRAYYHHEEYQFAIQRRVAEMRNTIRRNMWSGNTTFVSRMHNLTRYQESRARVHYKSIGEELRNLVSLYGEEGFGVKDCESLTNFCEEYPSMGWQLFDRLRTKFFSDGYEYRQCSHCFSPHHADDSRYTNDGNYICDVCCNEDFVYSGIQECYIHNDEAIRFFSSSADLDRNEYDWVSESRADRYYLYFEHDSYGQCCGTHEVYDYVNGIEPEPEPEPDPGAIFSWHTTYRNFVERNETKVFPAIGLELEVYAPDRSEAVIALRENEFLEASDTIYEGDGSLDREHGFEIITQPMGREEWDEYLPHLTGVLHQQKCIGYNEPAGGNYGIHLTIHRRHFTPLAEARLMMFMTTTGNESFIRAVAQRAQIYSAHYGLGIGTLPNNAKIRRLAKPDYNTFTSVYRHDANGNRLRDGYGDTVTQRKLLGRGKYCPINLKSELAEFRIFQSTTNPSSIRKDIEFVWALHAWTKPEASTGNGFDYKAFLMWLNAPANRKQYPFLVEFLSKKVFYCSDSEPIVSDWQHLMANPLESEAVEPIFF